MRHDEADVAWLAGLFEGEGCIYIRPNGRVALALEMTDQDVVERVAEIVGAGNVLVRAREGFRSTSYQWHVTEPYLVCEVLRAIRPWLGQRRGAKADEALGRIREKRF